MFIIACSLCCCSFSIASYTSTSTSVYPAVAISAAEYWTGRQYEYLNISLGITLNNTASVRILANMSKFGRAFLKPRTSHSGAFRVLRLSDTALPSHSMPIGQSAFLSNLPAFQIIRGPSGNTECRQQAVLSLYGIHSLSETSYTVVSDASCLACQLVDSRAHSFR